MDVLNVGGGAVVLSVTRPGSALTNSTTSDQDFPSIYTIPAGFLVANRVLRITLSLQHVTGVSSALLSNYLKVGTTKIAAVGGTNQTDSVTRSAIFQFYIIGTAAAGASVSIEGGWVNTLQYGFNSGTLNTIPQPVAGIATNGPLAIVPGIIYSVTGSTETLTLMTAMVEALN